MEDEALTTYCSSPGTFALNRLGGWRHCRGGALTGSPPTNQASSFRYKFSISIAFRYRMQHICFSDMAPIPPSQRVGCRKIKLTSISARTEPWELFLCGGSSLFFHCIDWCFVDRSYSKSHDSITHDDPSKKHRIHLAIIQKWFCPASRLSKPASNTLSSSPNFAVEFYVRSYSKYQYCQQHFWSFFGGSFRFLISLFQCCMQWLVD